MSSVSPLLLKKAREGDAESRDSFVDSFIPYLTSIARKYWRYIRGYGDAEDLLSEGLVAIMGALERVEPSSINNIEGYYRTVGLNAIRGCSSSLGRRARKEKALGDAVRSSASDPAIGEFETAEAVGYLIAGLSQTKRELVALTYLDGLPMPQACSIVGIRQSLGYKLRNQAMGEMARRARQQGL